MSVELSLCYVLFLNLKIFPERAPEVIGFEGTWLECSLLFSFIEKPLAPRES